MSTEQPISILPVPEPVKTQEAAATEAVITGPGPVVPSKDENVAPVEEEKTATTIKETEVKQPASPKEGRKPFAVLNNLFHRKEKVSASSEKVEVKETPKEEAPAVEKATEAPAVEAPAVEAPAATEESAAAEVPAEAAVAEGETPKKKDGFLDKLKHLVEKKEKAPKKSKDAEEIKADEAAHAIEEPSTTEVPALKNEPEIPNLTEPAPAPDAAVETSASTDAPKEEVKEETKEAGKKDKVKIGRRLSSRFTGIFSSPRKEKANPLDKSPAEEKPAEDILPAPVDLPKTEGLAASEPVSVSAEVPIVLEAPKETSEATKVDKTLPTTTVTAAVEEVKPEEAKPSAA